MSYKVISKDYFSNCLIEAIKMKLKNWKDIKIHILPTYLINEKIGHFYWENKITNKFYGFQPTKKSVFKWFFNGHVAEYSSEQQEELVNYYLRNMIRSLENKLNFKSDFNRILDDLSEAHWRDFYPNTKTSHFKENNRFDYIEGAYKDNNGNDIIKFYEIGKEGIINPDNDKILYWRIPQNGKPY